MGSAELKSKIFKRIDTMDASELKQAWLILKEISAQKEVIINTAERKTLEHNLATGIEQLDKGQGTNFQTFIGSIKKKYGSR